METWIALTIGAAFFQNLRSVLQKRLSEPLGTLGATYTRFIYALPFAGLYLALMAVLSGEGIPAPNTAFAAYALLGGVAQIFATALLLASFDLRSFAVGTTYSKTETVQTALFSVILLGEAISALAAAGIAVSLAGIVALSVGQTRLGLASLLALNSRAALLGLASGAGFAISAVSYRAAALALGSGSAFLRAALTLLVVLALQTAIMGGYLLWRHPTVLTATLRAWRLAVWAGLAGVVASCGWFTAMTLQNAAYVRALGQVELLFTLLATRLMFRERTTRLELFGIALVVLGIWLLLAGR